MDFEDRDFKLMAMDDGDSLDDVEVDIGEKGGMAGETEEERKKKKKKDRGMEGDDEPETMDDDRI